LWLELCSGKSKTEFLLGLSRRLFASLFVS
jgi:hypothetical protein